MIENTPLDVTTAEIFLAPGTAGDLNVQSAITTMIFAPTVKLDQLKLITEQL